MSCLDCGRAGNILCPACIRVAAALGYTADQRTTMLGAPPLIEAPDGRELLQETP